MLPVVLGLCSLVSLTTADEGFCLGPFTDPATNATLKCSVKGNGDFYGIGVRVGIYFTWMTSWLANNFVEGEIVSALDTNTIFLFALFLTIFYYSINHTIRAIDVHIILQLCVGFLFSIMSLWGHRTRLYESKGASAAKHFGHFGTHCRLVLISSICFYMVWFWIEGLDDGLPDCDRLMEDDCGGLRTFVFLPVRLLQGPSRGLHTAFALIVSTYYGGMTLVALIAICSGLFWRVLGKRTGWERLADHHIHQQMTKEEFKFWFIGLSIVNLLWIVFAMISIEMTLNLNKMKNVLGQMGVVGAGQIIPLLIGGMAFARILWLIFKKKVGWDEEEVVVDDDPKGLGLDMTTPTAYSPADGPLNRRHSAFGLMAQRGYLWRAVTAWLPWLVSFDLWIRLGSRAFQRLPDHESSPEETHDLKPGIDMSTPPKVAHNITTPMQEEA